MPACTSFIIWILSPRYYWLNAGILAVNLVAYSFIARAYTGKKPVMDRDCDKEAANPNVGCRVNGSYPKDVNL
jgi:hypothetical protein